MGTPAGIGRREREILTAIVETYISTGEPVGSRTLARQNHENLSAASIRNVMADLADAGFLEQPHTSAGRVPTAQAYRFYVKQLTGEARLSPADEALIQGNLQGTQDLQEFMERSSHVLSLISRGVGVTISSGSGQRNAMEHVYFQRMADKKVLAVVVMRNGVVRDRVLRLTDDLSHSDLENAAAYINQNFRGWEMETLRNEVFRRVQQERSEYDRLMSSLEQLYAQGALAGEGPTQSVTSKAPRTSFSTSRTKSASASCWLPWRRSSGLSICCPPTSTPARRRCAWLWVWKTPCRI